ncbi:MAG: hypothetical protein WDW36_009200 [Sanguina aurantia]
MQAPKAVVEAVLQPEVQIRKTGYRKSKATAEELQTRKVEEKAQQRLDSRQDTKMPTERTGRPVLLIDAYNVIFRVPELKRMMALSLEFARAGLEALVAPWAAGTGISTYIVYDAMAGRAHRRRRDGSVGPDGSGGSGDSVARLAHCLRTVYCNCEADTWIIWFAEHCKGRGARRVLVMSNDERVREGVLDLADGVKWAKDMDELLAEMQVYQEGGSVPYGFGSRPAGALARPDNHRTLWDGKHVQRGGAAGSASLASGRLLDAGSSNELAARLSAITEASDGGLGLGGEEDEFVRALSDDEDTWWDDFKEQEERRTAHLRPWDESWAGHDASVDRGVDGSSGSDVDGGNIHGGSMDGFGGRDGSSGSSGGGSSGGSSVLDSAAAGPRLPCREPVESGPVAVDGVRGSAGPGVQRVWQEAAIDLNPVVEVEDLDDLLKRRRPRNGQAKRR